MAKKVTAVIVAAAFKEHFQTMLLRKLYSFCKDQCQFKHFFELFFIVPIIIAAWTLVELRNHILQREPRERYYEDKAISMNFGHPEEANQGQFFQVPKLLPELDKYPLPVQKAITDAYNVSYQHLATIK